jgi:hypothetical protein
MIVRVGCVLRGVTSESFLYEVALRVLVKDRGDSDDARGHDIDGEVTEERRRGTCC